MTAERFPTRCYAIGGVVYVPHYTMPTVYVGPGGRTVPLSALMAHDAQPETLNLWARSWAQSSSLQGTEATA